MSNESNALALNEGFTDALSVAYAAAAILSKAGVKVHGALVFGNRRPTLTVDRLPEDIDSVVKQRYPNGHGGTTLVRAAVYLGCQLEWMHDIHTHEQATRIDAALRGKPHLEVVRVD